MLKVEMFKRIFTTGEILSMDDEFLDLLRRLIDDKIGKRLLEFFDRFESSGVRALTGDVIAVSLTKKIDHIKEVLMPTIKANTFHLDVLDKGILDFVSKLHIDTALSIITDRRDSIEKLQWLLDNREYWTSYIAAREKANYDAFYKKCEQISYATRTLDLSLREIGISDGVDHYPNLLERIKENKEFFYSPNEKKRATRMINVMIHSTNIEIILHGLRYQEMCSKRELSKAHRRGFRI